LIYAGLIKLSDRYINMIKNILVLLIFLGIIFVVIDLVRTEKKCPSNQIIYRFIPRTLDEELEAPAFATDVFRTMFSQPSPWIKSIDNMMFKKREDINQFFISQF
jgi:hypothetical protein